MFKEIEVNRDNVDFVLGEITKRFNNAKESVLRGIIEKIEGREPLLSDAENITLVRVSIDKEKVYYRNVFLGILEVSHDGCKIHVVFTPEIMDTK